MATAEGTPGQQVLPPPPPLPAASAGDADFIPSAAFAGARPGFVFQAGARGVGYYREGTAAAAAATSGGIMATANGIALRIRLALSTVFIFATAE